MAKRNMSEKSLENLEKGKATRFCGETAVIAQQKSAEVQREKGKTRRVVEGRLEANPELREQIAQTMIDRCIAGDVAMMRLFLELTGEKENERVELVGTQDLQISLTVKD